MLKKYIKMPKVVDLKNSVYTKLQSKQQLCTTYGKTTYNKDFTSFY